jgi:hypothetical protein
MDRFDTRLSQPLGRADARDLQQLRRIDRSGRNNHFGSCLDGRQGAITLHLDPIRLAISQ